MARPQKQTVDYFPHDSNARNSDTLTILQAKFGNDGYAFWFILLEILCSTEGHVIDCRNSSRWELLQAKTHVSEVMACSIIKLLVELEAIDPQLWSAKLIWCQKLVNNIADVYKNRRTEIPQKPDFYELKPIVAVVSTVDNPTAARVSTGDNPQSKLKYTKLKKSILKPPLPPTPAQAPFSLPDWVDKESWDSFVEMRKKSKAPLTERAKKLLIKKLEKLRNEGYDPTEIINQSVMSSWKGFYPIKEEVTRAKVQSIPGNRPAGAFVDVEESH